jgi:hypothetical protein
VLNLLGRWTSSTAKRSVPVTDSVATLTDSAVATLTATSFAIFATYATHPVKIVGIVNDASAVVLRLDLTIQTMTVVPIGTLSSLRIAASG